MMLTSAPQRDRISIYSKFDLPVKNLEELQELNEKLSNEEEFDDLVRKNIFCLLHKLMLFLGRSTVLCWR